MRLILMLSALLAVFSPAPAENLPAGQYPGVIHIHSNITEGGAYSLRAITESAKEKGIKILVFTDSFLRRWEYGLPKEEGSVSKYGIERYLRDLNNLRQEFPDILILNGVEVTPHYWWQGNYFKKNLIMNDWNKQFLVIGPDKYPFYRYLPVAGNRYFFPRLKDLPVLAISLFLVIPGLIFLKRKRRIFGFPLVVTGFLLTLNFFPFSASRHSPYHRQKDYSAHQDLINYVNQRGGLAFWSLPETAGQPTRRKFAGVNTYTASYPEALFLSRDYAGFGVNLLSQENYRLILAGGKWDDVLLSYCRRERKSPVWLIGESDYRGSGDIAAMQNVFLLEEFKAESVYDAFRNGKLYVRLNSKNKEACLSQFRVEVAQNEAWVLIKGNYNVNPEQILKIQLIRNGKIIQEFNPGKNGVFDFVFRDNLKQLSEGRSYYRLNIFADNALILASNPVFINFKNGH